MIRKNDCRSAVKGSPLSRGFLCLFVLACICLTLWISPAAQAKTGTAFTRAVAESSIRLFRETLRIAGKNENVLISPDSILTAMAIVENGAAGSTQSEMKKALGGVSVKKYTKSLAALHKRIAASEKLTYQSSNAVWYKKGFITLKEKFVKKVVSSFQAEVRAAELDAGTVNEINDWVSEKTNGKIRQILDRLDPDIRLVICNAVYFKGAWQEPYTSVKKRKFTDSAGKRKKVKMLEGTENVYLTIDGAEGFIKYYQGGPVAFLALLPPKGTSVEEYVNGLTGIEWLKGYQNRLSRNVVVSTRMPEFSYEYKVSLEEPLKKMGIKEAFADNADFSNMTSLSVCIDQVLHKTYIKLDRKGTEAAAVTAVLAKESAFYPQQPPVRKTVYLTRPFVYAIIDTQTGLPLFIGTVKKI